MNAYKKMSLNCYKNQTSQLVLNSTMASSSSLKKNICQQCQLQQFFYRSTKMNTSLQKVNCECRSPSVKSMKRKQKSITSTFKKVVLKKQHKLKREMQRKFELVRYPATQEYESESSVFVTRSSHFSQFGELKVWYV